MHLTERIHSGKATWEDVELLHDVASQMKNKCLCALGEFSIEAVMTGIDRFRGDFEKRVESG
jgi:NADH-quinone oxidoreductase subunit F